MDDLMETCEEEGKNYTRKEIKAWFQKIQNSQESQKIVLSNVKKLRINKKFKEGNVTHIEILISQFYKKWKTIPEKVIREHVMKCI